MGIRGIGNTKAKAFSQVALALTAVITNPENENASSKRLSESRKRLVK
jgi:hypothetical protein